MSLTASAADCTSIPLGCIGITAKKSFGGAIGCSTALAKKSSMGSIV
jgi:hypothetical protein